MSRPKHTTAVTAPGAEPPLPPNPFTADPGDTLYRVSAVIALLKAMAT